MSDRRGLLIILSSPSGAGKSSLAGALRAWDSNIVFSVSATTRAARPGEQDGREYHFVSKSDFEAMIAENAMLEHATVFGNLYGSPLEPIETALARGQDVLFDIDWQGGQQIRNSPLQADVVSIFLLPPSIAELDARLRNRGQDSDETIAKRMRQSRAEISHWDAYDYVLINRDFEATADDLRAVVTAERLKRQRRPGLNDFVRALNQEFEGRT